MVESIIQAALVETQGRKCVISLQAQVAYDPDANPYEVVIVLTSDFQDDVVWHVSRELLVNGIDSEDWFGEGDIQLAHGGPDTNRVEMKLRSHEGTATVALNYDQLHEFLCGTEQELPLRSENVQDDVEALLKEIFNS